MRVPTLILVALLGLSRAAVGQDPEQLQEFNRCGRWQDAAERATALLAEGLPR